MMGSHPSNLCNTIISYNITKLQLHNYRQVALAPHQPHQSFAMLQWVLRMPLSPILHPALCRRDNFSFRFWSGDYYPQSDIHMYPFNNLSTETIPYNTSVSSFSPSSYIVSKYNHNQLCTSPKQFLHKSCGFLTHHPTFPAHQLLPKVACTGILYPLLSKPG